MKRLILICLFIVIIATLCSCSKNTVFVADEAGEKKETELEINNEKKNELLGRFIDWGNKNVWGGSEGKLDKDFLEFLKYLKKDDMEKMRSMFSESAINTTDDFDVKLTKLADYIEGDIISCESTYLFATKYNKFGTKRETSGSFQYVITSEKRYLFYVIECTRDDFDSQNKGIHALTVITMDSEDDPTVEDENSAWVDDDVQGIFFLDSEE